jgi:hypothetical protein
MFQSKPIHKEQVPEKSNQLFSNAFKELFHSAGVVIGGILISALLVSREGRH